MKRTLLTLIILGFWLQVQSQTFTRVFDGDLITAPGASLGTAWGDYDNDGDDDVFIANVGGGNNILLKNNGTGTFTRITNGIIVSDLGNSIAASWGDYDNDGFLDLYVTNAGEASFLYHNEGNGTFTKVTDSGLTDAIVSNEAAAWGDYDNDGNLDLIVTTNLITENNLLYHNNGDGTFTLIESGPIYDNLSTSYAATWVDFNNDNNLDLFIANYNNPNFLYQGDGFGNFTLLTTQAIVDDIEPSWSASWADYNNDGLIDLIVGNKDNFPNSLYQNNGGGNFTKVIAPNAGDLGQDASSTEATAWADYNNDGWMDLFCGNTSGENNLLYLNNQDGTFTLQFNNVTSTGGTSLGSAWADFDNDGDVDLLSVQPNQNNLFFENNGNANNWIKIQTEGINFNHFGVGARVEVVVDLGSGPVTQTKWVNTQSGARGQNSYELEFGLGTASNVDMIRVFWPGGYYTELLNQDINQTVTVYGLGPDLIVYPYIPPTLSVENIKRGERVDISTYLFNESDFAATGSGSFAILLSTDATLDASDIVIGQTPIYNFREYGSRSYNGLYTLSPVIPANTPVGAYFILLAVDYNDDYEETNENNNVYPLPLNVVDIDLPDIQVTLPRLSFNRGINPGESFTIADGILNNGSAAASNVGIEFLLSQDEIADASDISLGVTSLNFPAGSTVTVQQDLTIPPGTPAGTYYLLEVADRDNLIQELDENNNLDYFEPLLIVVEEPPAPTNLTATTNVSQIDLAWQDNSNIAGYDEQEFVILRNDVEFDRVPPNTTTYTDFSVVQSESYDYEVYGTRTQIGFFTNFSINGFITANPAPAGVNTSGFVYQMDRNTDLIAGSFVDFSGFFDFSRNSIFSIKVYSPVIGTFKMKLEDASNNSIFIEVDQTNTVINQWETLTFDFSGAPLNTFNRVVIFPDFENPVANTFYIDDIQVHDQTIDLETGDVVIELNSDLSNTANGYIPAPGCTFDIPTNTTWTGQAVLNPWGCTGPANENVVITDNGDGTFYINDVLGGALCGDTDPVIFGNPCIEISLSSIPGQTIWDYGPRGVITWDGSTLTIPFLERYGGDEYFYETVFTPNGGGIPPSAPEEFNAEGISASEINIEWSKPLVGNIDEYFIERSETPGSGYVPLVSIFNENTLKFLDNTVTEGTTYYYRLQVVNADGVSPYTSEAAATAAAATFQKIVSGELVASTAGQGSAWGDYDGDGDLDLFTPTFTGQPNFFFENNGDGTFTGNNSTALTEDIFITRSGSWGDFNNDGFLDLFIANSDTVCFLFSNNGDKTFTKIPVGDPGDLFHYSTSLADFDNDGFVDVFVARWGGSNILFRNNGNNTFSKVPAANFPSDNNSSSWGSSWADIDRDGDLDLFVANRYYETDLLYINNGDGTFSIDTSPIFSQTMEDSRSPSWADADNDGDMDLFISTPSIGQSMYYINNGDGSFSRGKNTLLVDDVDIFGRGVQSYGSAWGDLDNDGWQDLFLASVSQNQIYFNNGDGSFSKLENEALVTNQDFTIGGSMGDLNNDGYLDLVVPNSSTGISNDLYLNNGTSGFNFLNVKLIGTQSNRSAIGAKVFVTANGITQYQEVSGQTGYGSQNSLDLEFGLGSASTVSELRIEWPSGVVQTFNSISANQFITYSEDGEGPTIVYMDTFIDYPNAQGFSNFKASITDVSSIGRVQVFYREYGANAADPYTAVDATLTTGDIYEVPVDMTYFGTSPGLDWYFEAEDIYGNISIGEIQSLDLETNPPVISLIAPPRTFLDDTGVGGISSAEISDVSPIEVTVFYSGITATPGSAYTGVIVPESTTTPGQYDFAFEPSYLDELGAKYYWTATDLIGNTASSDTIFVYKEMASPDPDGTVSGFGKGTSAANYQIFSIPMNLDQSNVTAVFSSLGAYNPEQWRVFNYRNGSNVEYNSGFTSIERGKGYWLISANIASSIDPGTGDNALTNDEPFTIQLSSGWNQIGNPYAFNVAWQDILDYNGIGSELSEFYVYSAGSYSTSDRISKFKGGFVNATASMTLSIPYTKNPGVQSGRKSNYGRIQRTAEENSDEDWVLPIDVSVGDITYSLAGVGMHPAAAEGRDQFDRLTAPRFINHLEVNFDHENTRDPLTQSIVPSVEGYEWNFAVETNLENGDVITLSWDSHSLSLLNRKVILFDNLQEKVIDMGKQSSYQYTYAENRQFRVIFGDENFIEEALLPDNVGLSTPRPNPFADKVYIPYRLDGGSDNYETQIFIYNLSGQTVKNFTNKELGPGYYTVEWDGRNNSGKQVAEGIYYVRLVIIGEERKEFQTSIVLKK